jgi:anti-sigma regulatory factor (Ser/Thr protein kinase)
MRLLLVCDSGAPQRARKALSALAAIDPVRDDAILVASELVSNSVMHGGCARGEKIELLAQLEPDALRLTITDRGSSGRTPTPRGPEYRGRGGMGLRVVDALARRWGSEHRNGTTVWAELSLDVAEPEPAGPL